MEKEKKWEEQGGKWELQGTCRARKIWEFFRFFSILGLGFSPSWTLPSAEMATRTQLQLEKQILELLEAHSCCSSLLALGVRLRIWLRSCSMSSGFCCCICWANCWPAWIRLARSLVAGLLPAAPMAL